MIRLADLDDCFEGVIPSVVATCGADGLPNISYLSHVNRVDDDHIALSNQFFGKTAANLRRNPCATILLVDGRTGAQVRVEAIFVRSETEGALFDRVAAQLAASSALADAVAAIDSAPDLGGACEAALDAAMALLGADAAMILMRDHPRDVLMTVLSRGYETGGAGAEVPFGIGAIGIAAATRQVIRVGDLGRVRRLNAAIEASSEQEARSRRIRLPGLGGALSHMAVPLCSGGALAGVLFVEARRRLAFGRAQEAAAMILARLLAAAMRASEQSPAPAAEPPLPATVTGDGGRILRVRHYGYDDSIFIDDAYIIKGVAGRILAFLIGSHLAEGRDVFSNREIRLAASLRLPGYRDNLETRLILLRRQLEEKSAPIRLVSAGRGQIRLVLDGRSELVEETPGEGPA